MTTTTHSHKRWTDKGGHVTATPIEVTRHGRTIGLYVPLPQDSGLSERERLLEAGRRMQAELERIGLDDDALQADFQAWRQQRRDPHKS